MHFTWTVLFWTSSVTFGKQSLQPTCYTTSMPDLWSPRRQWHGGGAGRSDGSEMPGECRLALKPGSRLRAVGVRGWHPRPLPAGPLRPRVSCRVSRPVAGRPGAGREGCAAQSGRGGPRRLPERPPTPARRVPPSSRRRGRTRAGLRERRAGGGGRSPGTRDALHAASSRPRPLAYLATSPAGPRGKKSVPEATRRELPPRSPRRLPGPFRPTLPAAGKHWWTGPFSPRTRSPSLAPWCSAPRDTR